MGARMERARRSRKTQKTSWLIPTLRATLVMTWYPPLNNWTIVMAACAFHASPPPPAAAANAAISLSLLPIDTGREK